MIVALLHATTILGPAGGLSPSVPIGLQSWSLYIPVPDHSAESAPVIVRSHCSWPIARASTNVLVPPSLQTVSHTNP